VTENGGSHGGDEHLLLLVHDSGSGMSCGRLVILLAMSVACCSSTKGLEVLLGMVVRGGGGWWQTLGLGQR
jgi:hypothetical protein